VGTTTPPLRDYQRKGVDWLVRSLTQHRAVLLADEMGLGKTLQALLAAEHIDAKRVLIVCPAGARRVWQQEIFKWLPRWEPFVRLIEPGPGFSPERLDRVDLGNALQPLILVIGYDDFSKRSFYFARQLAKHSWDVLICDEAHYLKNPSNRTIALYGRRGQDKGLQAYARRVILLTGTPTPNHAGELYQHCRTFWPSSLPGNGSLAAFEDHYTRYRDTVFGRQVTGSKNQAKLRDALKDVVLRRRKSDVLTELPPLQLQDIPLLTPTSTSVSAMDAVTIAQLSQNLAGLDDDQVLRLLTQPDARTASLRQQLGLIKTGPAIDWIRERLDSTNKILVFAWHHSVIDLLHRGLTEFKPAIITGNTLPKDRAAAVEAFQNDPHTRVFLGQILAAGTAITLTAASEVAIVEPSWVPGENVQAIGRAHRLGQRDSVLASFLYLPGTLDEKIMQVFRRKAAEISHLTGDLDDDTGTPDRRAQPGHRRPRGSRAAGAAASGDAV
jgi:SWI/SNF-related matrix-associated actin-dependent regulator 1 of chromatin subfamily A